MQTLFLHLKLHRVRVVTKICTATLYVCVITLASFTPTLSAHAAEPQKNISPKVILIVGDSLSAGYGIHIEQAWPSLLDERLRSQGYGYRVTNASVSGETSAGANARIAHLLDQHRPAILILEIGANDGLRGLPLAQTQQHLQSILDRARERKVRVLLIGMRIPPNYGDKYADGFYALFEDLAKNNKLSRVPFLLEGVALDTTLIQADGLHPTAAAQPRLLDNVWRELAPMLKASTKL
jgi:acyl-CoA thioesterase I